jgi:phosphatidylserine/phosphatidylglycerophosphate/cardiolipin synthase-like enzyme
MEGDAAHVPPASGGSYPLRPGNAVRPWVDGEPAFRRIAEAVEGARRSVWVTVAFHEPGFRLPDGRGSLFDLLDRAAARGVDVRALFWRSPLQEEFRPDVHFYGTAAQRDALRRRGSSFLARWDRLPRHLCHHQKSWLVDAGTPQELAFVGGINLDVASVAPPGHPPARAGSIHDVYLELRGPAASDVHHNFVQRWNEASERRLADGCWPEDGNEDLRFPRTLSPPAGTIPVQITRTVRREVYRDGTPAPGAAPFEIERGERSVLEQYLAAIDAARRSIYFEDQALASLDVIERLHRALARGVEVVFLVPGEGHPEFVAARRRGGYAELFGPLDALGGHPGFTLAGIATNDGARRYRDVYVHAKILLVDDAWATIGSTNVAERSFKGDTELNASFWHPPTVRALRRELLLEHLGLDTGDLDDWAALRLYREVARANRECREGGRPLSGLAFAIEASRYGL